MRIINLRLALETTILLIVCSIAAHADNLDTAVYARGGVRAKLEYCKDCHGLSGQGYRGYFTMPRLAGQSPQYLENQLRAFVERRRTGNIFLDLARVHGVNPAMRSALAAHFKELNPSSGGWGAEESHSNRPGDLRKRCPRIEYSGVLGVPRSRRQRSERNSSFGRPDVWLHSQAAFGLEQGARSGRVARGSVGGDDADFT